MPVKLEAGSAPVNGGRYRGSNVSPRRSGIRRDTYWRTCSCRRRCGTAGEVENRCVELVVAGIRRRLTTQTVVMNQRSLSHNIDIKVPSHTIFQENNCSISNEQSITEWSLSHICYFCALISKLDGMLQ